MADLPVERITEAPPFTYCGIDYFGPYLIKEGRKELKRYGVIFTCMASRALHIETDNSLDTDSCVHAIRRCIARRDPIRQIRTDNGTNFVSANKELNKIDHDKIRNSLLVEQIDWVFNPPAASHMGGI